MSVDDITKIGTFIVVVLGFGVNLIVQIMNGRKADQNSKTLSQSTEKTVEVAIETQKTANKTAEVVNTIASQTDGRLTQVISELGAQKEIVEDLRKELTEAKKKAAPRRRPPSRG